MTRLVFCQPSFHGSFGGCLFILCFIDFAFSSKEASDIFSNPSSPCSTSIIFTTLQTVFLSISVESWRTSQNFFYLFVCTRLLLLQLMANWFSWAFCCFLIAQQPRHFSVSRISLVIFQFIQPITEELWGIWCALIGSLDGWRRKEEEEEDELPCVDHVLSCRQRAVVKRVLGPGSCRWETCTYSMVRTWLRLG